MRPPLLTLALLGPLPASAFYPTKFRANLSMIPGISHEQMTEEVLTSAAGTLFPPVASSLHGALGVTLSRAMLEARTEIVWSNVRVDRGDSVPAWHFDGESDAVSADLLEGLKAALVKDLGDEDYGQARVNLGKALHLVQDYFAYSDAAMDGQDFEQLWQRDLFLQAALGSDDSQAGENDGEHSNLQKKGAEESQQDIIGLAPGDSDRHLHAVRWAKKASEAFITNVAQYVTDRQLQHLFGISLDSVILVDPVAFTSSDWDNAQVKVSAMFDAARDFDPQENRAARQSIVALLSQSPMVTYDNWSPLKSTNASQSLEMLRDTVSGYGIGCHGIDPATVLSALEQFRGGGELVLVVGQGFLADSDVEDQIVDFLANNPVAVTIMQLETKCQQQKTFSKEASTLSQSVADLSGGAYVTSLDTRQALAFPRDGALAAPAALSVIQKNSHTNATSGDDIRFLVDGAMDRLVITADWVSREKAPTSLRFSDPEDKSFEPVARSTSGSTQRAVWKIDNPTPGEWGFNFGGSAPSYNVTIKGRSPIQLVDVSFVESGGVAGHEGFFQIEKEVLPAEADLGVVSELYGLSSEDHPSVEWFIVEAATGDETKISMTPGLDPKERPGFADQNTFFGKATLPKGEFYVVVRGEDSEGYKFQRSVPSRLSAKYYPDETYNIGDVDSVVDFPDDSEEESEAEAEAEAEEMYRIVARQIMTGTGTGTGTPPLTPSGPFLTNATAFPGTGATTVGTNATATSLFPTLPTSVLPSIPGTSGFNTSVPSVTIPGQTSANFTDSESATETAGPVQGTASTVPTSPSVPGATESFTTVATIPSPGPLGTNSTSGIPSTSFGANATATSVTAKGETGGASATTVTVTEPCNGAPPPGQTIASQDAIPGSASSSSRTACRVCEAQSPAAPIPSSPKETFTKAQDPMPYSPPARSQETVVIPNTPAQKTVEKTKTQSRTSVVAPQTVCAACAPSPYGPANPPANPRQSRPAPSPETASAPIYGSGPFATGAANGTQPTSEGTQSTSEGTQPTSEGHAGHTTSSRDAEGSADAEEASGEGIKGVRAGVVAVVVVAVGGAAFLVL